VADLNDARREAYAKRDEAGRTAEAIEGRLQVARARGDKSATERLGIEYEAKLAEIREAVQLATDIEEKMEKPSAASDARGTHRQISMTDENRPRLLKRVLGFWGFGPEAPARKGRNFRGRLTR
jgi:hypothetical protein